MRFVRVFLEGFAFALGILAALMVVAFATQALASVLI